MDRRKLATDRQLSYAKAIAKALDEEYTFDKNSSYYDVNKYISENEEEFKSIGNNRLASIRQIDYANAISNLCRMGKNFDCNSTHEEVDEFITKNRDEYRLHLLKESITNSKRERTCDELCTESLIFICDNLFKKHGLYAFIGCDDVILYIGKSKDLSSRIPTSYRERMDSARIDKVMYYVIDNMADVNIMEILLIAENNPVLNSESKTEEIPERFKSGIDILSDFSEIPNFNSAREEVCN